MSELFRPNPHAGGAAVIGKGTIIKGSLHSKQDIFLDGEIEGVLDAGDCRLIIGPHGKVIANATAREVDIQGAIMGNVDSTDKVAIRTCGRLVGDIRTAGIVIESGAYFKGKVDIVTPQPEAARQVTNGK